MITPRTLSERYSHSDWNNLINDQKEILNKIFLLNAQIDAAHQDKNKKKYWSLLLEKDALEHNLVLTKYYLNRRPRGAIL